jgi:ADP-ribosyl-[dinitrogen reductase] hydrolase
MSESVIITQNDRILGGLWGSLVGDALGVPVEFLDRVAVQLNPVESMCEYGTHHQPRGTWSDDGSLILCTADSLLNHEFNLDDIAERFVRWSDDGLWTAWGEPFDIGATTGDALNRIRNGTPTVKAGGQDEYSNGNGSLMRILPVAIRFASEPIESFAEHIEKVSAITHGHARSRMACVFYGLVVRQLLQGWQPRPALDAARAEFTGWYERAASFSHFRDVLENDLMTLRDQDIASSGYVLHTLHASLWCLLKTQSYRDCVLKAVNLGGDTDTTACVAGGLAGVAYGIKAIPSDWLGQMARKEDVDTLFAGFAALCEKTTSKNVR